MRDTAYRSAENESWLATNGMKSEIHRKKPRGRSMSKRTSKANGHKSVVRLKVEHVFGHQKDRMGLFMRTIGLARARATITLANMAYNMGRLRGLLSRSAPA
ncbi:transposase [Rhodovulum sulfidophilum]|uniref:transposase n=1 Tax=Rhodovulum sulfidophilum TaxID=35806 RepID=UPI00191299EB|nr:transposase [Rhodovulum sulfidophilum]